MGEDSSEFLDHNDDHETELVRLKNFERENDLRGMTYRELVDIIVEFEMTICYGENFLEVDVKFSRYSLKLDKVLERLYSEVDRRDLIY